MGFNALADPAATCVHACLRAGCGGRSGGSCWAALHARIYACMHAGWLAGRRALGEIGRSVGWFRSGQVVQFSTSIQYPVAAMLAASDGERGTFLENKKSGHGILLARFCG
jgi:hypothetical protein